MNYKKWKQYRPLSKLHHYFDVRDSKQYIILDEDRVDFLATCRDNLKLNTSEYDCIRRSILQGRVQLEDLPLLRSIRERFIKEVYKPDEWWRKLSKISKKFKPTKLPTDTSKYNKLL